MSLSQVRERYNIIKPEGLSFQCYLKAEMEHCKAQLHEAAQNAAKDANGNPVFYIIARHVSRSGMSRTLSVHYFDTKAGRLHCLNYAASLLLGLPLDRRHDGVKITGCGMDMGFEIVYRLSNIAHNDGYAFRHEWL